eukprot:scaffold54554_cov59-Phaeocystis_antarctica.AAC.2
MVRTPAPRDHPPAFVRYRLPRAPETCTLSPGHERMATIDSCFQTLVHSLAALVITHGDTAPTEPRGALTCG